MNETLPLAAVSGGEVIGVLGIGALLIGLVVLCARLKASEDRKRIRRHIKGHGLVPGLIMREGSGRDHVTYRVGWTDARGGTHAGLCTIMRGGHLDWSADGAKPGDDTEHDRAASTERRSQALQASRQRAQSEHLAELGASIESLQGDLGRLRRDIEFMRAQSERLLRENERLRRENESLRGGG